MPAAAFPRGLRRSLRSNIALPHPDEASEVFATSPGATLTSMDSYHRSDQTGKHPPILSLSLFVTLLVSGCATPGLPRPPSLNLPEPARDLTAERVGNTVELHFSVPARSTDRLPLRGASITALFCREFEHGSCLPVASSSTTIPLQTSPNRRIQTWTDTLPPELTTGGPRVLGYQVELFNAEHQSAGFSAPAFTAAGLAPAPVEGLRVEGTRIGPVLRWTPSPRDLGVVILKRESGPSAKSDAADLTVPASAGIGSLVDTTAKSEVAYRYSAVRERTLQLGGRTIKVSSARSASVDFTLHSIYPPPEPVGLTAASYFSDSAGPRSFAIDLVWQPVDVMGMAVPFAGYILYRETINPAGQPLGERRRVSATLITLPAFHDTSADPAARYRYSVTAIDSKGNESLATTTLIGPTNEAAPLN